MTDHKADAARAAKPGADSTEGQSHTEAALEAGAQNIPADRRPIEVVDVRRGMFGATGTGDTSGYGGLVTAIALPGPSDRPYGGWFDEVVDILVEVLDESGTTYAAAVESVVVDREELTLHVAREHLVEVVYRRELESLAAAARELAASHPPDVALEEWMRRFVGYIAAKRGMATSLKILMDSNASLFAEGSGILRGAAEELLSTAAAQGFVRDDIDTTDLLHALSSIYSLPASPEWRDRSNRLIGLLMDGLRARK